jgi:mono/diheme cytochrome c family protein
MSEMVAALLAIAVGLHANVARAADNSAHDQPIVAGRAIYERACASCHGARGEGAAHWEEPDANGEMPAPPHDASGHTWKHSDAMLYHIVQQGWRDPFNKTQRLAMPAFNGQLSREETIAVIDYLKMLWKPEQRQFQAEESRKQSFPAKAP